MCAVLAVWKTRRREMNDGTGNLGVIASVDLVLGPLRRHTGGICLVGIDYWFVSYDLS